MSRYNHRYMTQPRSLTHAAIRGTLWGIALGGMVGSFYLVTPSQAPRVTIPTAAPAPCLNTTSPTYQAYEAWAVSQGLMTLTPTTTETGR